MPASSIPQCGAGPARTARATRVLAVFVTAVLVTALTACSTRSGTRTTTTRSPTTVTLLTAQGIPGTYLTDDSGRALYLWDADRHGSSTCYDQCAAAWPPLTVTDHAIAGPGVDAALIGTADRNDGTLQVTYGGWPLYYFVSDVRAGQLAGQGDTGFGAVWWVIGVGGKPLPSDPVSSTR